MLFCFFFPQTHACTTGCQRKEKLTPDECLLSLRISSLSLPRPGPKRVSVILRFPAHRFPLWEYPCLIFTFWSKGVLPRYFIFLLSLELAFPLFWRVSCQPVKRVLSFQELLFSSGIVFFLPVVHVAESRRGGGRPIMIRD